MKTMSCGLLLIGFLMSFPLGSLRAEEKKEDGSTLSKKAESHKFSGIRLKGHLKKPDLSYIYQRKGLRADQIVNIPENFNDEIAKDAAKF